MTDKTKTPIIDVLGHVASILFMIAFVPLVSYVWSTDDVGFLRRLATCFFAFTLIRCVLHVLHTVLNTLVEASK
ncbi:hypothetical protein [Bradyrhizobium sp. 33ap4]|uniref:hypothetical protein n=1 Tax=Bradyrhizobium sp. 33ap4 TaxID=3061630 RepID=UPI0029308481|nr:hypothetical protein [Bradyrhizobium sp. 33ap4]